MSRGVAKRKTLRGRVAIVGAGLAGAACAAALARRGEAVVLLEAESTAGRHSSGRNAGLVRQAVEDPVTARLCLEGARAIRARLIGGVEIPFRPSGSILIDPIGSIPPEVWAPLDSREVSPDAVIARLPWLAGCALENAIETRDDGIVEVHALLEAYLAEVRDHGGEIRFGEPALRPLIDSGAVVGVLTTRDELAVEALVIATGAWGAEWGERGGAPIALTPTRRSLIQTTCDERNGDPPATDVRTTQPERPDDGPWVWHLDEGWYFRFEAGGMLWCAGEELSDTPGDARPDPLAPDRLAEVAARHLPAVRGWNPVRHWAGHRTFCPDRRFLLGPDPRVAGWHWAVGLGGHGVTTSFAVGERVANAIVWSTADGLEPELAFRDAVLPASPGDPVPLSVRTGLVEVPRKEPR